MDLMQVVGETVETRQGRRGKVTGVRRPGDGLTKLILDAADEVFAHDVEKVARPDGRGGELTIEVTVR